MTDCSSIFYKNLAVNKKMNHKKSDPDESELKIEDLQKPRTKRRRLRRVPLRPFIAGTLNRFAGGRDWSDDRLTFGQASACDAAKYEGFSRSGPCHVTGAMKSSDDLTCRIQSRYPAVTIQHTHIFVDDNAPVCSR